MTTIDLLKYRRDFPSVGREYNGQPIAFFDGPGGTQVPKQVIESIVDYYTHSNANTHGQFITSRESDDLLEETRKVVAAFLNASSPREISFGANMTTLNFSLSRALGRGMKKGEEVLITQLDHEANRGPWLKLEEMGLRVREVALKPDGTLDYEDLTAKVNPQTRVVAVGWASNALGTVNNLRHIREVASAVGALLVVDAVHYAPHFPIDVSSFGIDYLFCSAYKFYGPHVGVLYSRDGLLDQIETDRLRTQDKRAPYRIETGTLNHAALAGVKAAIEYVASLGSGESFRDLIESAMERIALHEHDLFCLLYEGLKRTPGVTVFGPSIGCEPRAPTVSFVVEGFSPEEVARRLGEKSLLVWDGDFYAVRPAEILNVAKTGGWVRAGMSLYNTRKEVERLLREVSELAEAGYQTARYK
jgi:cysteine desulfurase family protein (TIGR01976 family)